MAFGNLTVDFKQLSRVPVRDRMALAQSPQASQIFGNLTPSQIAALFPDYYKRALNPMAGQVSSFAAALSGAASVGTGSTSGGGGTTGTSTASTAPTTPSAPASPNFIQDIVAGISPAASMGTTGASKLSPGSRGNLGYAQTLKLNPRRKALLDAIATDSGGGYGTINYLGAKFIGNETTDFSQHPFQDPSKRGLTKYRASGRYQITLTNYEKFAKQLGLHDESTGKSDFSPEAQDLIAYEMAKDVYRVGTGGRNLEEDINNPNISPEQLIQPLSIDYGWHILKKQSGMNNAINVFKRNLPTYEQELLEAQTAKPLNGTQPQTGEAPQGSDVTIENLKGTPADASVQVVPAPQGPAKTMLLSLGTNDFSDPKNTYQNTLDAINEGRKKGYNVVVVPPVSGSDKFKAAYDEVMRAVNETGAPVEQPQSYSQDGYHPTGEEYKRIGEKYQGAVVVGDSIAVGIGQYVDNGQTLATEGIRTDSILARVKSQDVIQLETAQVQPQITTFDPNIFTQLDPRVKQEYDRAPSEQKRLLEMAIMKKGVNTINEIMSRYPATSAVPAPVAQSGEFSQSVAVDDDVMYGRKPYITGHDFAVPVYTNGSDNKIFDEDLTGMTPQAIARLKAAAVAAKAAGLSKLVVAGGKDSSGHVSHMAGTEYDVKGYDANGNVWNIDQRAVTALGAAEAGSDRFGFYPGGTLHFGKADEVQGGPGISSAWGPRTEGVDISEFNPGLEKQIAATTDRFGSNALPKSELYEAHKQRFAEAVRQKELAQQTAQVVQPAPGQPLPGAEPQTAEPPKDPTTGGDVPIEDLKQPTAEAVPAKKLGGTEEIKEPNSVKESMSLVADGKEVAKFNKNEEVNVADGKINVQNEYQKKTSETQQKTDKGSPQQQQNTGSMRGVPAQSTDVLRRIPEGYSPISPSAMRAFANIKSDRHWEKGLVS